MLKKTMTYMDYNGESRTEDFWFNLTKKEILMMQLSKDGGLDEFLKKIVAEKDFKKLIEYFQDLILKSYGEKSPDGKRFIKNKELTEAFEQTEAFSDLFLELATNAEAASEFIKGIVPVIEINELAHQVEKTGPTNVASLSGQVGVNPNSVQ